MSEIKELLKKLQSFGAQDVYSNIGRAIEKKSVKNWLIFRVTKRCYRCTSFNFLLIIICIAYHRGLRIPSVGAPIFELILTENQRRAFRRLNGGLALEGQNNVWEEGKSVTIGSRLKVIACSSTLWNSACTLTQFAHEKPLVHLQSVIGCASFIVFSSLPWPKGVEVVCVGNDHSPVPVALASVAGRKGLRACYVQHAQVTDNFPPLSFDLAMLFDRASINAYCRSARRSGGNIKPVIRFLPPFAEEFIHPALNKGPYVVGVCLSALPDNHALRMVVKSLSSSSQVKQIRLRPHPRGSGKINNFESIPKVQIQRGSEPQKAFFEGLDITLVPNSGVAIDALHCGCPAFFVRGMDAIPDDYYGFVEAEILPEFSMEYLESYGKVNAFFNIKWRERYKAFDETVKKSPVTLQRQAARKLVKMAERNE